MIGVVLLALTACIPADVPPQLQQSPGPPVVVTAHVDVAELFAIRYPEGWRLVTSPAGVAPTMIFVAPDDRALIMVTTDPTLEIPPLAGLETRIEREEHTLPDGLTVGVMLRAPAADWAEYVPVFERVVASLSGPR